MRLRTRLFLLTLAMVVPALATAWLALSAAWTRERSAMERTLRETTRALALVVDRELSLREAIAWSLAASPSLATGDLAAFGEQASAATQRSGGWVVLRDPATGRVLADTSQPREARADAAKVGAVAADAAKVGAVAADAAKAGVSASAAEALAPAKSEAAHAPAGARATVSDIAVDDGRQYIAISVPAPARGAQPAAILSVMLEPGQLHRVLQQQALPERWTAAVLDRHGTIIARQPNPQRWTGTPATDDVRTRLASGNQGLFMSRTRDGEPVTTFISRSPEYGWGFIIGVPDAVAGAELRRAVLGVGSVAAALVLLAVVLAAVASRRIAVRVRRLQATARQLEAGEPAAFDSTDVVEFDEVGRTLVSASRRIGDANERLRREIDAAVRETARAQEQLAQAQRLEAIGRLTGGVAHDVNNLLSVVANNVFVLERLLAEGRRGDATGVGASASPAGDASGTTPAGVAPGASQAAAIRRAVETGRRLTQKLLAFSRRRTINPERIALASWLPASAALIRSSVPRSVAVTVAAAPDTPAVEVDVTELEVALLNLAVNAADAMPDGGTLSIRARAGAGDDGRPLALIEVRDSGQGIPDAIRERVFEPFFTTKDGSGGSGLGLSQVDGFCAQAGGSVALDSVAGQGTTVTMRLPAVAGAGVPADTAPAVKVRRADAGAAVLYVEDNEDVAQATIAVLRQYGYRVDWVASGEMALSRLHDARFDLVLSDIVMPGATSGLALALELRRTLPRLPVVLMTGYSQESGAAVAAGFVVLQKPCAPELLDDTLQRALARVRSP